MEPVPPRAGKCGLGHFVLLKFAFRNRFVNPSEILKNNTARSQIQVTDFGIPDLSLRQSDIGSARAQLATRIVAIKLIVKWGAREQGGVTVLIGFFPATGINPPAVTNNQDQRSRSEEHTSELQSRGLISYAVSCL